MYAQEQIKHYLRSTGSSHEHKCDLQSGSEFERFLFNCVKSINKYLILKFKFDMQLCRSVTVYKNGKSPLTIAG